MLDNNVFIKILKYCKYSPISYQIRSNSSVKKNHKDMKDKNEIEMDSKSKRTESFFFFLFGINKKENRICLTACKVIFRTALKS